MNDYSGSNYVDDYMGNRGDDIYDDQQQNQQQLDDDQEPPPDVVEVDFDDPIISKLPRIVLMGPRRGGKTSIQRVVFHKMSPHETLFRLEATQNCERTFIDHTPLCRFTIWDFPGEYYGPGTGDNSNGLHNKQSQNGDDYGGIDDGLYDSENDDVFSGSTSLIFVVDAQDEPYDHVLQSFTTAVTRAISVNPNIAIEVFINKVDGELFLSDESKYDCRRDIMTQVSDELTDAGVSPDSMHIRYHLTSIYDHSVYEALSRVVQRLIPQLPTLENLLNVLVSTCSMEKAYLFDVVSKLYVSTDSGPVDMQSVELCSDMIDVVLDVSGIYGLGPSQKSIQDAAVAAIASKNVTPLTNSVDAVSQQALLMTGSVELLNNLENEVIDPDSAYDSNSASVIRLSNGMVLYLKEVDTMLALVCITRAENFRKKSLINYNIGCLKKALKALVQPNVAAVQQ